MKFRIESRFPLPPEETVELLLDAELQEDIHLELGYESWSETARDEPGDGTLLRVVEAAPRVELPGFVRSAMGNTSTYAEEQHWSADRLAYDWRVGFELSAKIELDGSCRFEPVGEDECIRIIEADCRVPIPLVGNRIAAYIRDETIRAQEESAAGLIDRLEFEDEEGEA